MTLASKKFSYSFFKFPKKGHLPAPGKAACRKMEQPHLPQQCQNHCRSHGIMLQPVHSLIPLKQKSEYFVAKQKTEGCYANNSYPNAQEND